MLKSIPLSLPHILVFGFSILIIALAAPLFFFKSYMESPIPLTREKSVLIPAGASVRKISTILAGENIITHPSLFTFSWWIKGSIPLKAGEYLFKPDDTPLKILQRLMAGEILYRRLVIPEGLTTFHILRLLEATEGLTGSMTAEIAEGAFLPDTYFYRYGEFRIALAERAMKARNTVLEKLWSTRTNTILSQEQAVILASLVEKETAKDEERAVIAAVFINRLKKGIPLQSDPTVVYALTEGKTLLERPLYRKDLAIHSPYNTYLHTGLPPNPICNPGRKSLEAALNPAKVSYLYFVADGQGGHYFARSLKAHNKNVIRYRRRIKELKN